MGGPVRAIERFTRDERSAAVWWPLTLVLIVFFLATFPGKNRAVDAERSAAQARSVAYLHLLQSSLGSADLLAPMTGVTADTVQTTLRIGVFSDSRVNAVRLWTPDGTLLFSTRTADVVGSGEALNDAQIDAAASAGSVPISTVSQRSLAGEPAPTTFHTYLELTGVPQPVVGEVELSDAVLLSAVHDVWLRYQILLGLAAMLVLGLAILSTREPMAKIGVGVQFYENSIPKGFALIDLDEQSQLEQAGAHARARVAHVEAKLHESEEARRKAEGHLQRALSAIATRMRTVGVEPAIPRPAPPPDIAWRPPPIAPAKVRLEPVMVPEPESVVSSQPEPVVSSELEPVMVPDPESVVSSEPEPVASSEPEPVASSEPEPVAPPRPKPVAMIRHEPVAALDPEPPDHILQVPEIDAEYVLRVPEAAVDDDLHVDDESAADVLERLVEPSGPTSAVDPSVVRARLARLAASKKPGSRTDLTHTERRPDS
jgi:hypothetical protein